MLRHTMRSLAAVALIVAAPAMAAERETVAPLQAVMQDVGGARVMAFYTSEAGRCATTVMPDEEPGPRLRVALAPMATATVEGPDGASLALTCGEAATSMTVEHRSPGAKLAAR